MAIARQFVQFPCSVVPRYEVDAGVVRDEPHRRLNRSLVSVICRKATEIGMTVLAILTCRQIMIVRTRLAIELASSKTRLIFDLRHLGVIVENVKRQDL